MDERYVLEPENIFAFFNPSRRAHTVEVFEWGLEKAIPGIVTRHTRSDKCTPRFAEEAYHSNKNILIAGGGDGTLFEFISTLVEQEKKYQKGRLEDIVLCTLPAGSGNGRQGGLGIPHSINSKWHVPNLIKAITNEQFVENEFFDIDYGADTPITGSLMGINGLDVSVLKKRNDHKVKRGIKSGIIKPGAWNYISTAFFEVLNYMKNGPEKEMNYSGTYKDGSKFNENRLSAITEIATRDEFGIGFKICPDAKGYTGMHLYSFDPRLINLNPITAWNLYRGNHEKIRLKKGQDIIRHDEIENIIICSDQPVAFHVDGEYKEVEKNNELYSISATRSPCKIKFATTEKYFDDYLIWKNSE